MKKIMTLILVAGALINTGCSSGGGGGGGGGAGTFTLSGAMNVSQTSILSVPDTQRAALASDFKVFSLPDTQGQAATQCSDGFFYQVYCLDFSDNPTAKSGSVTCSGSQGAFTVAGLPLNSGIGCFVRKSTDGATFTTVGNITLPAASLTGTTSTLSSAGDVGVTVAVSPKGVATTVSAGAANLAGTTPADASAIKLTSGFYKIVCGETSSAEFSLPTCKCQQTQQTYVNYNSTNGSKNAGHLDPQSACIADGATEVPLTDTAQFIEMNFYKVTPATAMNMGNGAIVPAGTSMPVISVWGASSSTVSNRSTGGEGASTTVLDNTSASVTLNWDTAQATNAIAWKVGAATLNGVSGFTIPAMPAYTATNGTWIAWVQSIMQSKSPQVACTWSSGATTNQHNYAGCIAEFTQNYLRNNSTYNLPKIWVDRLCSNSGCDDTVANARAFVQGVKFPYASTWTATSQASVAGTLDGVSPGLNSRYVLEPFEAIPGGGGGFSQQEQSNRNFECATTAGKQVQNAACNGTQNFLNCNVREETAIRFVPTAVDGTFKAIFNKKSTVNFATLEKWTSGTKTTDNSPAVAAICNSAVSNSEAKFFLNVVKQ